MRSRIRWLWFAVLWSGGAGAQQMAITFDDLPSHGDLPPGETRLQVTHAILATLAAQQLPPTYGFINAAKVAQDPSTAAVLEAWRAAGQPLANHSWSHADLTHVSARAFEADVARNEASLEHYMSGENWHWFRYPYLHEGETLEKRREVRAWLTAKHYRVAQVNMDFEDYLWNAPYARCMALHDETAIAKLHDSYLGTAEQFLGVFRELSRLVYGRDVKYILLMHVGAFDAKMLPELLAMYRAHGISFISLEAAEADPAYRDDPDIGLKYGGALLEQMMAKRRLPFPPASKPYAELDHTCTAAR